MTIKLYDSDPMAFRFEARVLTSEETKKGYLITLDQSAFFPEGGGQKSDRGHLGEASVSDVQEKEGVLYHLCDAPLPVGASVKGEIDQSRRLRMMEHHSGEHLLSGLIKSQYGYENVGFHLSDDIVTLDTSGYLSEEQTEELERQANAIVRENRPIRVLYPSPEEAEGLDFRSKLDIREGLRLVEIEGADLCACCAPHVSTTGQIGMIAIVERIRYKGGTRLTILCGGDAFCAYQAQRKALVEIARGFSVKPLQAPEAVTKKNEELEQLKQTVKELNQKRILALVDEQKGIFSPCLFTDGLSPQERISLCDLLCQNTEGLCGIFLGSDENGYAAVIGKKSQGMKALIPAINSSLEGKGGGSDQMYHGTLKATREKIEKFFQEWN